MFIWDILTIVARLDLRRRGLWRRFTLDMTEINQESSNDLELDGKK